MNNVNKHHSTYFSSSITIFCFSTSFSGLMSSFTFAEPPYKSTIIAKLLLTICIKYQIKNNGVPIPVWISWRSWYFSFTQSLNRPFALRGKDIVFMKMKVIWFYLEKSVSGPYLKENNSDLVFQTHTIFLKCVSLYLVTWPKCDF